MRMLKFCRKYVYEYKMLFFIYLFTVIVKTIISFAVALLSGSFIDMLVSGNDKTILYKYCIAVMVLGVVSVLVNLINGYIGTKMQALTSYAASKNIFEHMTKLPISYLNNQDIAYLSQRINTDTNGIFSFFIDTYISLYVSVCSLLISFAIIIRVDGRIALLLGLLACVYCAMYKLFKKPLYNRMQDYKEKTAAFFGSYYESMDSIGFIKNHSITDIYKERLDGSFLNVLGSLLSYQKIQMGFIGCDGILTTLSNLIIYLLGGVAILAGEVTIGIFTVILNLFGSLLSTIKFFLSYGKSYQETLVSFDRITYILNVKPAANGDKKIDAIRDIRLEKVSFSYNRKLISAFSYEFKRGNIYYIVGSNGIGKSTLLNIILGQYIDEMNGKIYINDIDMKDIDMQHLKSRAMGFSEQETYLIADTLYNNLTLFGRDDEKMNSYNDWLALSSYINRNENGLETEINVQQNNLSGGEKQKISIIRQFLMNPDVMIFDEPMASLEHNSRVALKRILEEFKKDKIIIVVTHDFSMLDEQDIVIDMEKM